MTREEIKLSPRQAEVLALKYDGVSTRKIAARLGVTASTVTSTWSSLRKKVGARSSGEVFAICARLGMMDGKPENIQPFVIFRDPPPEDAPAPAARLYAQTFSQFVKARTDEARACVTIAWAALSMESGFRKRRAPADVDEMLLRMGLGVTRPRPAVDDESAPFGEPDLVSDAPA